MTTPDYPGHGKPCNGCGLCCLAQVCGVGQELFKIPAKTLCPALELHDGRYRCGLMTNAAHYFPVRAELLTAGTLEAAMRFLMASGDGCDTRMLGHPADKAFSEKMEREAARTAHITERAANAWGLSMELPF